MAKLFMHGSINIQQTRIKIIIIVGVGKQILNKIDVIEEGLVINYMTYHKSMVSVYKSNDSVNPKPWSLAWKKKG